MCATNYRHALNLVGCKALLLSEKLKSSHYLEIFDSLIPELKKAPPSPSGGIHSEQIPALRHLILTSDKLVSLAEFSNPSVSTYIIDCLKGASMAISDSPIC